VLIYSIVFLGGCGTVGNGYSFRLNGVPLTYADSGATATDAKPAKGETKSWWSENWPYVVVPLVVIGGVVGGLAAAGAFKRDKKGDDNTPPVIIAPLVAPPSRGPSGN
jgi:hypothetical protein